MWPKCLAILSVQINGEKIAPRKNKGRCAFFCNGHLLWEISTILCRSLPKYYLPFVQSAFEAIIICPSPPYCNLHTIVKGKLQWIQNGFHICHLKRLHCTQAIFNYCIVFLQQFFTLGCHDIKRLQFSVRGASDQISPLHRKCLIFQPMLDWIDSNVSSCFVAFNAFVCIISLMIKSTKGLCILRNGKKP